MVDVAACSANSLEANGDSSAEPITLPFDLDFYTRSYDTLWVNNNGNVTVDGPLSTFTPFGLVGTDAAVIAPFFADVDTRASGSVTYGWAPQLGHLMEHVSPSAPAAPETATSTQ